MLKTHWNSLDLLQLLDRSCIQVPLHKGQRTYSFVIVSAIDSFIRCGNGHRYAWRQSCLALGPFNHELVRLCYGLVLLIKSKLHPAPLILPTHLCPCTCIALRVLGLAFVVFYRLCVAFVLLICFENETETETCIPNHVQSGSQSVSQLQICLLVARPLI